MSRERQEALLRQQIREIEDGIEDLKRSRGERSSIKDLERTRKSLEAKLEKLLDKPRDDVVTFEQLGVDRLFVDEAHNYKNLFLYTKMRNVAGLSTTDAQKSSDMYLKCRYLDEITGGKGIVFATGTPVSNSMTELYTMMRYLQHDMLERKGLSHFDSLAATFGETQTAIELAPEGTDYRARTRFAKFFNLPELINLFKEAADIKTSDQLHLPIPEAEFHNIVAKPTEIQQEIFRGDEFLEVVAVIIFSSNQLTHLNRASALIGTKQTTPYGRRHGARPPQNRLCPLPRSFLPISSERILPAFRLFVMDGRAVRVALPT